MEKALTEFKTKIRVATGREALEREISDFYRQSEVALAHRQPRVIQVGLCDFQTLSGTAQLIEVSY